MAWRERAQREERWQDSAHCLGHDPNLFIPSGPGGNLSRAKAICAGCPHTGETGPCAQYAAATGSQGVWGGIVFSTRTDNDEREAILTLAADVSDAFKVITDLDDARPQKVPPPTQPPPSVVKGRATPKV